jgi:hypothetical protein
LRESTVHKNFTNSARPISHTGGRVGRRGRTLLQLEHILLLCVSRVRLWPTSTVAGIRPERQLSEGRPWNRLRSAGLSAAGGGLVIGRGVSSRVKMTRNRTRRGQIGNKLEVDCRTSIHHFVARSKVAVGIAADIIKQPHGPVPCLSLATMGAAGLRQPSEALRTRYCTRMKRRATPPHCDSTQLSFCLRNGLSQLQSFPE